jgi:hypothetical protein
MTSWAWATCLECRAVVVSVLDQRDLLWDPNLSQKVELIRRGLTARVDPWRNPAERVQVHRCCGRRLQKIRDRLV